MAFSNSAIDAAPRGLVVHRVVELAQDSRDGKRTDGTSGPVGRSARECRIGGFGIGLAVTANILAGGPVTGASMNPARSFGPALIQGVWDWHGLYWVATIAGAVTAALVYEHVILKGRD